MKYLQIISKTKTDCSNRLKFWESLDGVNGKLQLSILAKEIDEQKRGESQIQRVLKAIKAREECLREIDEFNETQLRDSVVITEDKLEFVSYTAF